MINPVCGNCTNYDDDIYMNVDATARQVTRSKKITLTSEPNTSGRRCYRLALVCVLMLVLMLAVIILLWVKLTERERDQIQTSYSMIFQRDQLETSYNNLTAEKKQLEISCKRASKERDQLQNKVDGLQKKLSQLKEIIDTLGWKYFNSSIYFISTEKSWSESRHDCQGKGADLVIINNKEEQDMIEMWRQNEGAWIGATDQANEGDWKWLDGTAVSNGFWSSGEPNNAGEEDCAVYGYESIPKSNDVSCSSEYIWICEKRINS